MNKTDQAYEAGQVGPKNETAEVVKDAYYDLTGVPASNDEARERFNDAFRKVHKLFESLDNPAAL